MNTEHTKNEGRLINLITRRWEQLDWQASFPPDGPVVSEAHYLDVPSMNLSDDKRWRLNRLFACFTCELFIHFERYLVEFLQRNRYQLPNIPAVAIDRFIAEEQVHTASFFRLLHKLRPDLYDAQSTPKDSMRFLIWSLGDEAAVSFSPIGSFFLLAWLFEEITLFLPIALDRQPEQCAPLLHEVMRLHAKEELAHVAIDERILANLQKEQTRFRSARDTILSLPLLVYADLRAKQGWRNAVALLSSEITLSDEQRNRLLHRGPSLSDQLGIASFADKIAKTKVPLAQSLSFVLKLELRRHTASKHG
ncbi:MAG TPA: diiron oxygenase [Pseudomonadota bacterium]|nr:diiron oxygenase [Pseudomonadota bacterium]